ncbi:NADPH-dependent 7-cyano-7-deazaguanine reductase QueF [Moraxella catarrhalis]|uniref:NADPH dependent preQ0 reductase n=1 Tax=Moraxella catarrhalis TaxID=480 RepID=A0AB36DNA0_MORCA|nr:NADPH-dependent 7-cyano-7-deazaguanine reductase QueF [Moraxella catarrhalis]MPX29654.1 NADPH-dependent 7-cyano-7-deazaguanine reductase QueF [Moraxella catarrhalis]OAV24118.1 NADPH dependent preQ0 reductase [Moraxella catarrhalis]RKL86898.1 NADPH-dependent 7-cyano-7-deazaguanine reductase QueF [Moraxella catarrhalis]RKL89590.1 NADPH-dependent 7-cyano-7-deazaguanine reductase QueF [Moraxella catarrhalis]RKL98895.1 NADPH-dependent 7-cyano-7-deazaguanine reductase QueF [Moraxella catarrhalis]
MSIHGVLGETTSYPKNYDASILFAISRHLGRDEVLKQTGIQADKLTDGVDVWQAFELSWLNLQGICKVAIARIRVPANSPNIVESKSLKLYLNSLNFTKFGDMAEVQALIQKDLSACVGAEVSVEIVPLGGSGFEVQEPLGICIDEVLDTEGEVIACDDINSAILSQPPVHQVMTYQFHTNLLRSNCPVTSQPDWGTLSVSITTNKALDYQKILRYVLTFRQHNGFHEQCVELIFADLLVNFEPSSLMVQANYTRRGGIDINPVRVLNHALPAVTRQVRQ